MKRWILRLALAVAVVVVVAYLAVLVTFQRVKRQHLRELEAGSKVVETGAGPMEYALLGQGPVALFLHGTPGGYDQGVLAADLFDLSAAGISWLVPSRPGYLRTPLDVGRTVSEQADAFAALLDALVIDRVAVIGGSGGGPFAVQFARQYPERTMALILAVGLTQKIDAEIEPPPLLIRSTNTLFGESFLNWLLFLQAERKPLEMVVDGIFSEAFSDDSKRRFTEDPSLLDGYLRMLWTTFPHGPRDPGYRNDSAQFSELDLGDLSEITVPTLVVHGTDDRNAPYEHGEYAAAKIPGAELVTLEGGDHFVMVSRPQDFWPPMVEFIHRRAAETLAYPRPSGEQPVGVRDFELVDHAYPVERAADAGGRRLMVRAWYPAAARLDERRRYFADGEREVLCDGMVAALGPYLPGVSAFCELDGVLTHSYEGAPVVEGTQGLPTLVFSHGGLSFVSQNTALMEELASHGYLCLSVAHPGGSSGVLFPDGDRVAFDAAFRDAIFALPQRGLEIDERYRRTLELVDEGGLGPWARRWRDDLLALVDLLDAGTPVAGVEDVLARADLGRLAYFGMSYGAAAAVSAAQVDERARVAANFDGTHWLSDVLDTHVRVPLLVLTSEAEETYSNSFFFEPLLAMGDRDDIVRVRIPNVTHLELGDDMFLPASARAAFPGGGSADGTRVHQTVSGFLLAFFDHYLRGMANGYPSAQFQRFPEVERLDLRRVKAWANAQRSVATEP